MTIGGTAGTDGNSVGTLIYNSGSVTATGTGTIGITGSAGGAINSESRGVDVESGTVSTNSGALSVTGTSFGSVSGGLHNVGIDINGTGSITSTSGTITLTGTGGSNAIYNYGISVDANGSPNVPNGTIGGGSGDILIDAKSGSGIGLDTANIQTTGNVTLNAEGGGTISQTAGYIQAAGLRVLGDTGTTNASLTSTGNHVTTLVADLTGSGGTGTLSYTDSGAFDIGSLTTNAGATGPFAGVTTTNGINVGTTAGDIVTLTAGGGTVTQSQTITADGLELLGAGSFNLNDFSNSVNTLAANLTGVGATLTYDNAGALTIGTVNSTSGVTTVGGAIDIETNSGDLTVNQSVASTGSGNAGAYVQLGAGQGSSTSNLNINNTVDGGTGNVNVWADNNVVFAQGVVTGINTLGTAYVFADNAGNNTGAIIGSGTGTDVAAGTLIAYAAAGIGSSTTPLATSVGTINLYNNSTGDIFVSNTGGDMTVKDVNGFGYGIVNLAPTSGQINLTNNGGSILVDAGFNGPTAGIAADGTVTLTANGASSNISAWGNNNAITSDSGNVVLNAGQDILIGDNTLGGGDMQMWQQIMMCWALLICRPVPLTLTQVSM